MREEEEDEMSKAAKRRSAHYRIYLVKMTEALQKRISLQLSVLLSSSDGHHTSNVKSRIVKEYSNDNKFK